MDAADRQGGVACIGLGSNLGDSLQTLTDSWQRLGLQDGISLKALSPPYRTEPVGMESRHWFINAVGLLRTTLSPEALLDRLLIIEQEFGRRRNLKASGYQDRTLDLDLLLYDDVIINTPRLQIPHPELHKRLFVLVPLAVLVPNQLHPRLQSSMDTLRRQLLQKDNSSIPEQVHWPPRVKS